MNLFQILGLAGIAIAILRVSLGIRRHRFTPGAGALWLVAWLAAAVFLLRPEWTVVVARRLGIARGADLVFYCGILAGMLGFLAIYLRLRRIEDQLTRLVREIAIDRAATPDGETGEHRAG
jgi:hypothetical protein